MGHGKLKKHNSGNQPTVDCFLKPIQRYGANTVKGSSLQIRTAENTWQIRTFYSLILKTPICRVWKIRVLLLQTPIPVLRPQLGYVELWLMQMDIHWTYTMIRVLINPVQHLQSSNMTSMTHDVDNPIQHSQSSNIWRRWHSDKKIWSTWLLLDYNEAKLTLTFKS